MQATALNMTDMVGIGPFVVTSTVIMLMGGPPAIFAWLLGALLAFSDGFVWAELGAAMPEAGGSYVFLRELYGRGKLGSLMAFLFIWQTTIQAPLVIASGAIGFSNYAGYLVDFKGTEMASFSVFGHPFVFSLQNVVAGSVVIILVALLYRKITSIGKISVFLWGGLIFTIAWIIFGGLTHFNADMAFDMGGFTGFPGKIGEASISTIYCFLGYYNVCHLGGEIKNPQKNIPRSILISVAGITIIYLLMQISIMGVVPWQEAGKSNFVLSLFMEKLYGKTAASIATGLILLVAFASLFSALLGYSRIPYAAAADGKFFPVFAKLHPTRHFPYASLLIIGALAFVFSLLFRLGDIIKAIIIMRIIVQFIGQAVGVIMLHRSKKIVLPFRMWLYPLPALLAILIWAYVFYSASWDFIQIALLIIGLGLILFFLLAKLKKEWPFEKG